MVKREKFSLDFVEIRDVNDKRKGVLLWAIWAQLGV